MEGPVCVPLHVTSGTPYLSDQVGTEPLKAAKRRDESRAFYSGSSASTSPWTRDAVVGSGTWARPHRQDVIKP